MRGPGGTPTKALLLAGAAWLVAAGAQAQTAATTTETTTQLTPAARAALRARAATQVQTQQPRAADAARTAPAQETQTQVTTVRSPELTQALRDALRRAAQTRVTPTPAQEAPNPNTTTTTPPAAEAGGEGIPANIEWVRTTTNVRRGGRLEVTAGDGRWSVTERAATRAARLNLYTNADGFIGQTSPETVLPSANVGALIGKIGQSGAPFLVGAHYLGTAAADGPLYLAINDAHGGYGDNPGRMPVRISFTPPRVPPPPPPPATTTTPPTTTQATPETTTPETTAPETTTATQTPPETPTGAETSTTTVSEIATTIDGITPPPPQPSPYPSWLAPAAGVFALVLAAAFLWPRPKKSGAKQRGGGRGRVSTRLVKDGRRGQRLTVTLKGRR